MGLRYWKSFAFLLSPRWLWGGGEHRAGLMQPWICGLLPYSRENFKGKHFACCRCEPTW